MEEATGSHSGTGHHLRIYFDWCATLGLTDADMADVDPIPETAAFEQWRYFNAYKGDWIAAIAGIAFIESASAKRNDMIIESSSTTTATSGAATASNTGRYTPRRSRRATATSARPSCAATPSTTTPRAGCGRRVRRSIDLQWLAFDGMYRAFILKEPRYARWQE